MTMKIHRIAALMVRHLYLYQRSLPRLMDLFYWPVLELMMWGFLSYYLEHQNLSSVNLVSILLGGIIFWNLLSQSQRAVSIAFLEDVWERNLLNVFVTPLKVSEFLISTVLFAVIQITIVGIFVSVLALLLYHFNVFQVGLALIPSFLNLLLFGWMLGLFAIAIILRFGSSAQIISFGVVSIVQPFSAVFYPISALPSNLQWISYLLPSTYVFEGMRSVIATGVFSWWYFAMAFLTNIFYLALVYWFFYAMFARIKDKGMLMKLE